MELEGELTKVTAAEKILSMDVPRGAFHLFTNLCKGCGLCKEKCPKQCLIWAGELGSFGTPAVIPDDPQNCIACGICQQVCPDCAILIQKKKAK